MVGRRLETNEHVGKQSLIQQAKMVLSAGGTVYLGETHTESDGRLICIDILQQGCVQFLCIEVDTGSEDLPLQYIDQGESLLGHKPPIKMSAVITACQQNGGQVIYADAQWKFKGDSVNRQGHFGQHVLDCRRKVSELGKGVLVLIGSDHLKDVNDNTDTWRALQTLVYSGLSFDYGWCGSCLMVWQLS